MYNLYAALYVYFMHVDLFTFAFLNVVWFSDAFSVWYCFYLNERSCMGLFISITSE